MTRKIVKHSTNTIFRNMNSMNEKWFIWKAFFRFLEKNLKNLSMCETVSHSLLFCFFILLKTKAFMLHLTWTWAWQYPCMYFLAPGQAHDSNNPGIGSLIHWMSFNDGFWISNDDCILMLHTDSIAAEIILPANSALASLSVVRPGASQICYRDLGNYNCRLSASNRTLRYTITYIEHSTKSDCDYNL